MRWMEKLRRVLGRGKGVVIGMDANAKSEWWGKGKRDNRGRELEEEILRGEWGILNEVGQGPTFVSASGSSYIDITVRSEGVVVHG